MQTAQITETQPVAFRDTRLLLPVKDAATTLGISVRKTWSLIASNDLETKKIGARTLCTIESVRRVAENGA